MKKIEHTQLPFKSLKDTYPEHYQTPEQYYSRDDPWRHADERKEDTKTEKDTGNKQTTEEAKKARIQELKAELDQLTGGQPDANT